MTENARELSEEELEAQREDETAEVDVEDIYDLEPDFDTAPWDHTDEQGRQDDDQ